MCTPDTLARAFWVAFRTDFVVGFFTEAWALIGLTASTSVTPRATETSWRRRRGVKDMVTSLRWIGTSVRSAGSRARTRAPVGPNAQRSKTVARLGNA